MNRLAVILIAVATVLLLGRVPVHAVAVPHNSPCLQCHVTHNKLGDAINDNLCLTCHNYSAGAKAQAIPFAPGDAADPFGGELPSPQNAQISHSWMGSDTRPEAGAQPPTRTKMVYPMFDGIMTCAKCHNLHGPRSSETNSAPFLRDLNDQDQMCLDCHRSRNKQTHIGGSHPVMKHYSSIAKTNQSLFYFPPRSSKPTNPTAAMNMPSGNVICSTCHKPHYADSDSSTFDNHSSALLGLLTPSAGYLLRSDFRGTSAVTINICTNCHAAKGNHNDKNQNIQCNDCHGAHVEYIDPADVARGEGTPNTYLLRRYMNYSGGVKLSTYRRKAFMINSSVSTIQYRIGNGRGICEACHALPLSSDTQEHSLTSRQDCVNCHNVHGGQQYVCGDCHGLPPQQDTQGQLGYGYDPVTGYSYSTSPLRKDESQTPHMAHSGGAPYQYGCSECHKGNIHNVNTFADVYNDKAGILAATAGSVPVYSSAGNGACGTTYCHSNGAPAGQAVKYAVPAWGMTKGSIIGTAGECIACHGGVGATFNNLSTNTHFRHVSSDPASGFQYGCVVCHATVVSGNTAVSSTSRHVDGIKNVGFAGTLASGTSWTGTTCSTSYCHSDGKGTFATPSWTSRASGACGTCHATTPSIGGALISSGAHFVHFSTSAVSYGPMLTQRNASGCQGCHPYTSEFAGTHVDGAVNIYPAFGYVPAGGGKCTPCHGQGTSWTGGPVTCESCHSGTLSIINGVTAPDMGVTLTEGHGRPDIGKVCLDCHDRNKRHLGGVPRLKASLTGSLNRECKYCHDDGTKIPAAGFRNMSTHVTAKGGGQAMACAACHQPHGTDNLSMIRSTINGETITYADRSTDWIDPSTDQGLCQVCHTVTKYYKAGVAEDQHFTSDCFNCHRHNSPGGAFTPVGGCDTCHGYPPAPRNPSIAFGTMTSWPGARFEDYSGGGGAHLLGAHIPKTAKASEGWANCALCHNGGIAGSSPNHKMSVPIRGHLENITINVDPAYRFDNSFIVYTGAKLFNSEDNVTGSCFNISCHMSPSPRWSIER